MKFILLIVFSFLLWSCNNGPGNNEQPPNINSDAASKLTADQSKALEAFDLIQVGIDSKGRLYSTFPNSNQPCYPADSSFVIPRTEFLVAMKQFTTTYCTSLPPEEQLLLAESVAKAQAEFQIAHCSNSSVKQDYKNGLPMTGTWVLPNFLGRRDVTMIW
ncbi:hypothetical protein [Portibacter lacus]|uniref:Uncharacterized protein n=1 Tax=Portibacter lacus TaxID=1099794 RepID=A0AA37SRP5_9BACT|nr:hypothetical protein [Portibacter lacus]GLR18264.1 hypothetical protein GCM10007940_28800 [Portibacter lacus]